MLVKLVVASALLACGSLAAHPRRVQLNNGVMMPVVSNGLVGGAYTSQIHVRFL